MNILFDASALFKRYSGEPGAHRVKALQMGASQITAAVHCKAEIASALTQQWREGLFATEEYDRMLTEINKDFEDLLVFPLTPKVERNAMAAMRLVNLRGVDALHIATAQAAGVDLFVSADRQQTEAAQAVGLKAEWIGE
ncbi:MAG: type II toxin-antitoxin system VapC family toxin [Burkholderiaceae bacterium]